MWPPKFSSDSDGIKGAEPKKKHADLEHLGLPLDLHIIIWLPTYVYYSTIEHNSSTPEWSPTPSQTAVKFNSYLLQRQMDARLPACLL